MSEGKGWLSNMLYGGPAAQRWDAIIEAIGQIPSGYQALSDLNDDGDLASGALQVIERARQEYSRHLDHVAALVREDMRLSQQEREEGRHSDRRPLDAKSEQVPGAHGAYR